MIEEYTLEDDTHNEFRGGTLRMNPGAAKATESISKSLDTGDSIDKDTSKINTNCQWGQSFISPFTSIPNKISVNLWNAKVQTKPEKPVKQQQTFDKTVQPAINIPEDPNNFFTFRDGVVENAVRECREEFLDEESDGPLIAYFLLTQINHWDTDKERLVLLTPKSLVMAKYDFIALKRLAYKKLPLEYVEQLYIGDLVYPNGSLIPRLNGFADGFSNIMENCLFSRWSNADNKPANNFYQSRERHMRGIRLLWKQEKPQHLGAKWNPFNDNVPFCTFTYHPLYFHKDCIVENRKNIFNLDLFIDKLCDAVTACQGKKQEDKDSCAIYHKNIVLENYIGLGSLIHNRNSLGFFKVRGKFSF